mmetsp:Transcript_18561/g.36377  ORF Transcript_18561/g.36377 Transcript_18561/m.36377 type:complete len:145 (+) Transcript_18561:61-495(+)|eukprot:CAMPEP_0171500614 /NCGR_PEP_ID=MMETSP0958-20121227/9083_1 /TAXON_ID=87120 /ORGANISM="Aurantiochytrium limacinum, Strain ATCCMYA-1381" /LENGTH=144 /DNA_ID=CAMNT_0012035303 /DNA_START=52 /DNA_END=486 /DNA_ORIENTATION=+
MVKLADSLLWELTKGPNAFTVKSKHGDSLTREPFNITNIPSRKFSGLANSKAVGMEAGNKAGNVALVLKTRSAEAKPSKAKHVANIKVHSKGFKKSVPTVEKLLQNSYRQDLAQLARKRVYRNAKAVSRSGRSFKAKARTNKAE